MVVEKHHMMFQPFVFFPFPTDFNLCMQWVQGCGKSEYFHDFAYGGAQPFLQRYICIEHFKSEDFINADNISNGLKKCALPIPKRFEDCYLIKNEVLDVEDIDINKGDEDSGDDMCNNFTFNNPIKSVHTDDFKSAWLSSLELEDLKEKLTIQYKSKIPNESDEERKIRNQKNAISAANKRAYESEEQQRERKYKNAIRAALRRSLETEEQQKIRRMKNALRAAYRRAVETPEQREERRRKDMMRSANRRRQETELQAKIRRYNDAIRAAYRRSQETDEQRAQRRMIDVVRAARRRNKETPEQRATRLKADRERAAKRRLMKKLCESAIISDNICANSRNNLILDNLMTDYSCIVENNNVNDGNESDTGTSKKLIQPEVVWCT